MCLSAVIHKKKKKSHNLMHKLHRLTRTRHFSVPQLQQQQRGKQQTLITSSRTPLIHNHPLNLLPSGKHYRSITTHTHDPGPTRSLSLNNGPAMLLMLLLGAPDCEQMLALCDQIRRQQVNSTHTRFRPMSSLFFLLKWNGKYSAAGVW